MVDAEVEIENEEEIGNIPEEEKKEILKSVSLDELPKKKAGRPKKDLPTPEEVTTMSDKEIIDNLDSKTKSLYNDFSSFLEKKTDITPDTGTKSTISTGFDVLDAVMGGGFAIGTLGVITGAPGSGKPMLAVQALAKAQEIYDGNILTAYLDSEEAITTSRMANLGVVRPKLKPYNDVTVEKVFKFLEGICLFKEEKKIIDTPTVIVWDSIANTLSQKEREVEDINSVIGYKARLLSILIPKYVAKLAIWNICMLAINQLRDVIQIGMFSAPKELKFMSSGKDMPGGNVLKFNAFHLLEMNVKEVIKPDKFGFEGIVSKVKCVKNKLFRPNIEVALVGDFSTGFSNFWTNFRFLADNKRLETSAWNYLIDLPNKKFRTVDAQQLYKDEPIFKEAWDKAVSETIKSEIVEKYAVEEPADINSSNLEKDKNK